MGHLVDFLIVFLFIFLFDLIFVVFNKKKREKIFTSSAALIIKGKYKVTFENESKKKFALIVALADAFICGTAYMILRLFNSIYFGVMAAAIVLAILIVVVYLSIGYYYKKKEVKKNV